jgi:hypothetical protein
VGDVNQTGKLIDSKMNRASDFVILALL